VRTPGTWCRKALSPSREVGSTSSCSFVSSVEVAVDVVSTNGEAPETVIVSDTAPTFISESTRAVNPTVSRTPSRRTF
jgi:hypothetical protein